MSAVAELARVFEEAGLVTPPVPNALFGELRQQQPWVFTTQPIDPMAMYMFGPYVAVAIGEPVDDYIAICHAGHGFNSYAINYHLVYGSLAIFAQTLWGGAYQDPARSSAAVSKQLKKIGELLSAAGELQGSLPSLPTRLIVAESDFHAFGHL